MIWHSVLFLIFLCSSSSSFDPSVTVNDYVASHAKDTFRPPQQYLKYPYLVPAGPYDEMWDWDSVFMGVGLLPFGSAEYFAGSMKNFLDHTDPLTGEIGGCITPSGPTPTIHHAKPVIIQGAWLVASYLNDTLQFLPFKDKMKALLDYWERERKDPKTGLYVWYDQLESGADNLPTSICPSNLSSCWIPGISGLSLASADIMTFLYREVLSYSKFLQSWAALENESIIQRKAHMESSTHYKDIASDIITSMMKYLWDEEQGIFFAFNTTTQTRITNRVFLMCFPVFGVSGSGDSDIMTQEQVDRCLKQLTKPDMFTTFGIRSTSSSDPRYNNDNEIIPYSNWRGPIWVISNVVYAYSLRSYHNTELSLQIATNIVNTLANDINTTATWHESYDSVTGTGLAAPGFLSWNTLGANLIQNVLANKNPFLL